MLTVQLFQAFACHVGVYLRFRQITVTQEHLHHAQISAVIQQVGSKRVTESMGRKVFRNIGFPSVALDDVPEGLARHAISAPRREQVISLALEQNFAARAVGEFRQPAHRLLAQGNQPFAVSLAEYARRCRARCRHAAG